jgi:hypothetical protein
LIFKPKRGESAKKVKKKVKKRPVDAYASVYIGKDEDETGALYFWRLTAKTVLVCMATAGLSLTLAQIYKIPVPLPRVAFVSVAATVIFNLLFILLKKRAIAGIALILLLFSEFEDFYRTVSTFFDYILHILQSRLLATARYAARSFSALQQSRAYVARIEWTFLAVCVVLCLVFTVSSRSRYIGVMLITTIFLLIPAFGAEIAGYVPGIELLVSGMFGIYAMWAAHAGNLREASGDSAKYAKKKAEPLLKLYPGKPPHYYKYSRNALTAACVSLIASYMATSAFAGAVRIDLAKIIEGFSQITVELPQGLNRFFKYNFGVINDNGYFNSGISSGISSGLSVTRPPSGRTPIIKVTLEDDAEKVYLKGGLGVDFLGDEWSTSQNSREFRRLNRLLADLYPEAEYQVYRQKLILRGYDPDSYIGLQRVRINYLIPTKIALLPTQPYELDYKKSDSFDWDRDTVLRPKNNSKIKNFECYSLYPKMSNPDAFGKAYYSLREFAHSFENAYDGAEWVLPNNMSTADYEEKIGEYYDLISYVYGRVPDAETENIDRLIEQMGLSSSPSEHIESDFLAPVETARYVCDYLKNAYAYSLTVDNAGDGNTVLGNFLFDTKRGHCAMYATAMTLAMRQLGFPARYVTGYTVSGGGSETEDGYEYELRESDTHAWVEVYFSELGWVPFDPTGGSGRADDGDAPPAPATTAPPLRETSSATFTPPTSKATAPNHGNTTSEGGGGGSDRDSNGGLIFKIIAFAAVALIPVVLAAAVAIALRALKKAEAAMFARFKDKADNKTAEEMYRFMFRLLKAEGITVRTGETPVAFAKRTDMEMNGKNLSLSEVMPVFEKLEFSGFDLTPGERASLYGYVSALYHEAVLGKKRPKRLLRRIMFSRWFPPGSIPPRIP